MNTTPDSDHPSSAYGAAGRLRRLLSQRAFWHSLGFLLALAIAWLVMRAYRQPDFMIDLANMQFC